MSLNKQFGYAFGGVYVAIGLIGFAITSGVGFASTEGKNLIFFELNPLHNLVHLGVGALLLGGAAAGVSVSRAVNTAVGAVYLLVGLVGLAIIGNEMNILALNHPDNVLHLFTAVLALSIGLAGERSISEAVPVAAASRR